MDKRLFTGLPLTAVNQESKEFHICCPGDSALFNRLQCSLVFDYLRREKKDISLSDAFYI